MNDSKTNVESAMDNRMAKTLVRVVVWVLPGLVVLAGSVASYFLNEISATQKAQSQELQNVTRDVQVLNAKLDNGVIWRITELERRVNHVEQAQRTP